MTAAPPSEVALVVVTHNSSVHLHEWLEYVDALRASFAVETCVVDCGSSPQERDFLKQAVRPRVEHLLLEANLGYGAGCNLGAARTTAPVLVFLNPDSYVLSLPSEFHTPESLHGRLIGHQVLIDGRFAPHAFRHLPTMRLQLTKLIAGPRSPIFALAHGPPAWVSGSGLAISRRDFDRIGGWSTDFFLFYEDADVCARHRDAGGSVEVAPGFRIEHGRRRQDDLRREFVELRSGRLFVRRRQGALAAACLYIATLLIYLPRRFLVTVIRRNGGPPLRRMLADAFFPSRALRRLQRGSSS
jgi:N-acetylglucosaminyl-diphospho-decaprenol L-rhamnosyltransferase